MFQFQHINYLWALLAIPIMMLLYRADIQRKKNTLRKIGDPILVNQLIKNFSATKFFVKYVLLMVAFAVGVIALANPRKPLGSEKVNRSGIDVLIALDVSKSMLADDIKPNRLERAKQVLVKLIDQMPNDRVGIVVFAGRAYLQMPLTSDHAAAKMYLNSATPEVVPTQGTVIGDALKMCYAAFNTQEKKYKAVVLISDGEDHDESAVKLAAALAEEGVMLNTIGIGSPEGATIFDKATNQTKTDEAGNVVLSKLNEETLKSIAKSGNGLYQLFTNTDEVVNNLDKQLKTMGQRAITQNSMVNYKSYAPWLLALMLLLVLLEFFISEIKFIDKKNKGAMIKKQAVIISALLFVQTFLMAQSTDEFLKKGNDAFHQKQYSEAAQAYKKAVVKDSLNEKAQYNLGNALYKQGDSKAALQAYDAAIKNGASKADQASSWYNKGVALQNKKQLPECIDAYKHALRLNPEDEEARFNLQKALQQQQQEQQKKPQDNKDKKPPKDDPSKQKDKPKDQDQKPKPQQSTMTQKEAEEKLKALLQQEKNLQNKLRKVDAASPNKPEQDW